MAFKTVLVAGASGIAGRALVDQLRAGGDSEVLALARNAAAVFPKGDGVTPISCDLSDRFATAAALAPYHVNTVYYAAAYNGRGGEARFRPRSHLELRLLRHGFVGSRKFMRLIGGAPAALYSRLHREAGLGECDRNLAMLRNALDAVRTDHSALEHVTLMTGGRYYGHHLGPDICPTYRSPYEEDFPRLPGRNWYYTNEDYIAAEQAKDQSWHYSIVRPSSITGFGINSFNNLGTTLAVYATLLKDRGLPLIMPAARTCREAVVEFSPADMLAKLMLWTTKEPRCRNEAYNGAFGCRGRWIDIWGDIAAYFRMPAEFTKQPMCVKRLMKGCEKQWRPLAAQHGLAYDAVANVFEPSFLDQQFLVDWDAAYSDAKVRKHGFAESISPRLMFHKLFDELVALRVIPAPG